MSAEHGSTGAFTTLMGFTKRERTMGVLIIVLLGGVSGAGGNVLTALSGLAAPTPPPGQAVNVALIEYRLGEMSRRMVRIEQTVSANTNGGNSYYQPMEGPPLSAPPMEVPE